MSKSLARKRNGSMTVEACIIFPVFICFLLLIVYFIRLACINMVLDHAVNETAKQLATASYPISFLNGLEDSLFEQQGEPGLPAFDEEMERVKGYALEELKSDDFLGALLSGNIGTEELSDAVRSIAGSVAGDMKNGIGSFLTQKYAGAYYDVKTKAKYAAAAGLIRKFCDNNIVDIDDIKFLLVELPQGNAEFYIKTAREEYCDVYLNLGLTPRKDDVVIAIEYTVSIPLPFFGSQKLTTRHIAVERAWLNGHNGVYAQEGFLEPEPGEGESERTAEGAGTGGDADRGAGEGDADKTNIGEIVYITNYGSKYHIQGCEYLSQSKISISLDKARNRGYSPCKICVLKTEEYHWKKK